MLKRSRVVMSTRILGCLSVMLVVFQASSAPVDVVNLPKAPNSSENYEALPVLYTNIGSTVQEDYTNAISKAEGLFSNFTCAACRYAVKLLQDMFDSKMSFDAIADAAGEICYLSHAYHKRVCKGVTQTFKEEVLTVFGLVALSPEELCAGYLNKCGSEYDPFHQRWNVTIPGNKPSVAAVPSPMDGAPVTRILQLTDLHYDPLYTEGLSNDCGDPLCCRPPNKQGSGKTAAGPWGDYNCDVPNRTIVHLFENLRNNSDQFDWVYWTGDITAHNIWNQTRTGTLQVMQYFYDMFSRYLPGKPLFPTFGNHDVAPVNGFPQPFIKGNQSMDWVVEPTVGNWSQWLSKYPDWNTTAATIRKGGFYNVKVRDGLRVIGLQTTYCEKQNFWLLVNATDPAGQLQWLANQLFVAEKDGDKVHIIGHHPPGMFDSVPSYADNYRRIVNRFESTIVGQFFGHTHADSFKIFTDDELRPTNVLYISPGVTSYQGFNLGYRIYTIDGEYTNSTHSVLDHETYVFDLDKANYNNSPEWALEYSAKKAYNMSSLQPDAFYKLWKTMKKSNSTLELYNKYWYKSKSGVPYNRTSIICDIVSTTLDYNPLCSSEDNVRNSIEYFKRNFPGDRLTNVL